MKTVFILFAMLVSVAGFVIPEGTSNDTSDEGELMVYQTKSEIVLYQPGADGVAIAYGESLPEIVNSVTYHKVEKEEISLKDKTTGKLISLSNKNGFDVGTYGGKEYLEEMLVQTEEGYEWNSNLAEILADLSCECVKKRDAKDCDVGGEGSTGCAVGQSAEATVMGNGGGGSRNCQISCRDNRIPCCNY